MLVAVAVLCLLLVILSGMVGLMSKTWLAGQQRVNNFMKARAMLDLFARDIQAGVFRADLAAFPVSSATAFYTRRPGISAGGGSVRNVSLIEYQLDTTNGLSTLERSDLAILWSDPATQISFGTTNSLPQIGSVTPRSTAPGVVDFRILFIGSDGSANTSYPTAAPAYPPQAIGITLAVIDDKTLKLLTSAQLAALKTGLEGAANGANGSGVQSVMAAWETYLNQQLAWRDYPKNLADGLKIFERYVPLPSS